MPHNELIKQFDHQLNQMVYLLKQQDNQPFFNVSKDYLYKKNWTLVIGTQHSGKTAFLEQAELNTIQEQTDENPAFKLRFNQEGVFIELPSLSLDNPEDNILLGHFVNTIKTYRKRKPFDNILLTINMYTFIHEYEQYVHYLNAIKGQLKKNLKQHFSHQVDFYIVFTHMDKVAGFCDFFSDFSAQYPSHALGYILDGYHSNKKLLEQNEKKYDRLLNRLHENLIALLHKTRNNLTRYLIREFPQQLDSLRNMIRSSVSLMAEINEPLWKVKGIFFSSACQRGICVDRITVPISQSYQLTLPNYFPQASREQPYFIKGIIKIVTKNNASHDNRFARYQKEHKKMAYWGYAAAVLFFVLIGWGYHHTQTKLNKTSVALHQYQTLSQEESFTSLLPELSYLSTARDTLNQVPTWFVPFATLNKTKHWISLEYRKTLSEQFLPQVAHKMEEWLVSERNPATQYAILKAYLMLGNAQHLDPTYLKNWLHHYLNFSSETDLKSALLAPFPGIPLNRHIIEQVRNNLNVLPSEYLVYALMKDQPLKFIPFHQEAFTSPISSKGIPNFYTRDQFEKQYTQIIPEITHKTIQENWILKKSTLTAASEATLVNRVRDLYVADYLNWWRLFIYHTQPKAFNTWEEASTYFELLTKTSPFVSMLNFIQTNTKAFTHPNATQGIFNTQIAAFMETLNRISPNNIPLLANTSPLNALSHYFSMVSAAPNKGMMAFNTTKQNFLNTNPAQPGALEQLFQAEKTLPAPLNQWFNQIASNSWFLILFETKNYINAQWQQSVMTEYQQNIVGRFPLSISSEKEISLDNFTHFFNRNGTLALFFETYISPFLNTHEAQWEPKKIDHFELSFHPDIILEFERSNVIREMFFPNQSKTPSVRFIMEAMELQPIVSNISLDINGTILKASQSQKESQAFNWPDNYANSPVTLSMQNITGEQFQTTEYGLWGVFRLFSQANIQPIASDPRTLQVIFDLNGNAAQYLLRTTNPINPFVPDVIQGFSLPENIL